jgi:hypothetical protein
VISGNPAGSVTEGEGYLFTPNASDPDGDTLRFTIANRPAWASFNSQTGALSGTPQAADVGSYSNISISVSDGTDTSTLTAFTIVVEQAPVLNTATLNWTTPTTRDDGTPLPLSEIDGYRIYMGDSESTLVPVLDINDYTVNQHTLTDIASGTHYFSVTAYDVDGNESDFSNIVMMTAN